jgi:CheY-like chemotaxis protein
MSASILIVDDEPHILRVMRRALERYETCAAGSALEALALLEERQFDLLLVDLTMPDISGPELSELLEARQDGTAQRLIWMTGGALPAEAFALVERLQVPILRKPFALAELRALIEDRLQALRAA